MERYNKFGIYMKNKYGERVQRLPINAGFTCPNKTGERGTGGCIFCDSTGSGFASCEPGTAISEQITHMINHYEGRANKFLAYFQSNTNTYAPIQMLKDLYDSALVDERIIGLDISTRPDAVPEEILDLIASYKEKVDVIIEYGMESINPDTLKIINRGHSTAEFIDAVLRAKKRNLEVVAHYIVDFPWDSIEYVKEMAKVSSALKIDGVKLHSLYYVEGTKLGEMYNNKEIIPITLEEYVDRVILFLEYLSPEIVIHRLCAEPPTEGTLHGNWGLSKLKLQNMIDNEMRKRDTWQGKLYNYL